MHFDFMPPQPDRQVLILFAYTAMDSLVPPLVQEIGLSVTGDEEALHFSSSGSSVQELNRNLRVLPVNVRAFELVVATRMVFYGVLSLARSRRFELPPGGEALEVPCAEPAGLSMQVQALGVTEFGAVRLRLPRQRLQSLVQQMEVDTAANPHVVESQLLLIVARGETSDEG